MALDEELLSRNNQAEEADKSSSDDLPQDSVSRFNAGKAAAAKEASNRAADVLGKTLPIGGPAGLAAKLALKAAQKNQSKDGGGQSDSGGNPATSGLLKAAWQNIITTWGLSVIWIDIHIFLSRVLGKDLFCSLGQEWFPKGTPRNLDGAKRSAGLTESMAVGCLNLGCLILVLAFLSLIAMIVTAIDNPLKVVSEMFGTLWRILVSGDK